MNLLKNIFGNELFGVFFVFFIFLVLILTSCASNSTLSEQKLLEKFASDSKTEKLNMELTKRGAELRKEVPLSDYKLGPSDLLDIKIFQTEELNVKARISAMGYIGLPLIGKVKAGGLTITEFETLIAEKYEQYLQEPVVNIFIEEYRSQQILVLGSVRNPKVYYVTGQVYLLDIISMAGGLSEGAGEICIVQKVTEKGPQNERQIEKIMVDLNDLLVNGVAELNIPMSSGDVVHVMKSGIFFVDGAVNNAGNFNIQGKTTLTQAISMAKGLSYEAIRSKILIYRDNEKPGREVITADYNAILNGKSDDIDIMDKDIIIVPSSLVKSFFQGFATSLSFGVIRFGKGF